MRKVKGHPVPQTIDEARALNYKQLEKACELFNEHGQSAEDIQRAWDNHYWHGFDEAINLINNIIGDCKFLQWISLSEKIQNVVKEFKNP